MSYWHSFLFKLLAPTPGQTYLPISSPQVPPLCVPETEKVFYIHQEKIRKCPLSLLHEKSGDVPWDVRKTHLYKALQRLFKRYFLLIPWRIDILMFKLRSQQPSLKEIISQITRQITAFCFCSADSEMCRHCSILAGTSSHGHLKAKDQWNLFDFGVLTSCPGFDVCKA